MVAVQAQTPASPYLALWNRVTDFDPADLDAAFAGGAVVKSNRSPSMNKCDSDLAGPE